MNPIDQLAEKFAKFPGIGPRAAKRFVFFLLRQNASYLQGLAREIESIKRHVDSCKSCGRFYSTHDPAITICHICNDVNRDDSVLMIVEKDVDLDSIEKSRLYDGRYFVLGDTIRMSESSPQNTPLIKRLQQRVDTAKNAGLKEVILALSLTSDGIHTMDILRQSLDSVSQHGVSISLLGRGLSTGTELEYSDAETLKNAFKNRR